MLISHHRCVVGNAAILMLIRSRLWNSELREVVKVKAAAPPDASGGGIGDVSICCVLINAGRCRSLSIGILGLRTNARLFWRTSNDKPSAKISTLHCTIQSCLVEARRRGALACLHQIIFTVIITSHHRSHNASAVTAVISMVMIHDQLRG